MKKLQRSMNLMAILFAVLLLVACGGGGGGGSDDGGGGNDGVTYSGSTDEATVDDENEADDVSRAAGESTLAAIRQNESEDVVPLGGSSASSLSTQEVSELQLDIVRQADADGYSVTPFVDGTCGGTATVNSSTNGDGTVSEGSVVYNNFCVSSGTSGQIVFNGTVEYRVETDSGGQLVSYEFSYQNFTVSSGSDTQTLNASIACSFSSGVVVSCTTSSEFEGSDGRVYQMTDFTVSGDGSTGYDIEATVYDPDHGYVSIVATGITTNCANGNIDGGTITISDSTGDVVTVTFNDCSSYTVTYDGVSRTVNW